MEKNLEHWFSDIRKDITSAQTKVVTGKVKRITGNIIKVSLERLCMGDLCLLKNNFDQHELLAEVVGFEEDGTLLTPLGDLRGISGYTDVIPLGSSLQIQAGPSLLGKILNGLGKPFQVGEELNDLEMTSYPVYQDPPSAMERSIIDKPIGLGIKSIDTMLTCGEGQRMGIFAGAGVGKSSLMAQIVRCTECEVVVIALIGERGREVREFIERDLGEEGMKKSVVVIATSDRPPMEKLKAAYVATAIAEYFRDQGKQVLMLLDSLTRFARAQREIGLAAGEPPTRRGFPPSVFTELPKLLERTGQSDRGSITALYTVLVEGDDLTDPIADEVISILDGHLVLSRDLASQGHFPAVDVLKSVSRVMNNIVGQEHNLSARKVRNWMTKYNDVELLLKIGEYQKGSDPVTDEAIDRHDEIMTFLQQDLQEGFEFDECVELFTGLTS